MVLHCLDKWFLVLFLWENWKLFEFQPSVNLQARISLWIKLVVGCSRENRIAIPANALNDQPNLVKASFWKQHWTALKCHSSGKWLIGTFPSLPSVHLLLLCTDQRKTIVSVIVYNQSCLIEEDRWFPTASQVASQDAQLVCKERQSKKSNWWAD